MRILLIAPGQKAVYGRSISVYPPLGLLYLASALEQAGHQVRVLDIDAENAQASRFISIVRSFAPHAVGFTATTPLYPEALRLARRIKAELDAPIIFGGPHATAESMNVIMEPAVDVVAVGEAEQTVVPLFSALEHGDRDLSHINGIVWKEGAGNGYRAQVNLPASRIEDLESLAFPAVNLLPDLKAYRPPDALHPRCATIMTGRGCPAGCSFCETERLFGKKVRLRGAAHIADEIEYLIDRFRVREIHIADDAFTIDRRRTLAICREIEKRGIRLNFFFMNGLRADQADFETLSALREIGFQNVGFGVEARDDKLRAQTGKGLRIERVEQGVRDAKKLGFSTWLFFIIGLWGETDQTARQTIDFAKQIKPDYAKFFILKPFPDRLPTMTPERMAYWHRRANREFYLRPSRIVAQLANIRSWTQLRSNLSAFSVLRKIL
ncbi:MAG: hypothetical protein B6244_07465 [Candidatus Cloacimonetes bacterium 4572_55]|nr:MAG: hypothetical protein B6244_07465 [Candidatus Cloacimonetes bacterium 4572_55]